jgi:hypothetical protein
VRDREDVADFAMVSPSKRSTELVQIVSVPADIEFRDDFDKLDKLERRLERALADRGVSDVDASLWWTGMVYEAPIPKGLVRLVARWIAAEAGEGQFERRSEFIYPRSSTVGDLLDSVSWCRLPGFGENCVKSQPSSAIPEGDGWIRTAVEKKVARYGGASRVSNVILLVVGSVFLEQRHVEAFLLGSKQEDLPFKEIWVWGGFCALQRVKPLGSVSR